MAEQGVLIHAAHWPALSSFGGFEEVANPQIQAMMLNHALTAQCFVICASSPTSPESIAYMEAELGPQEIVKPGVVLLSATASVLHNMQRRLLPNVDL